MILYAEFTAKPGSESGVGRLISGLAEKVRREPGDIEFTVYRERDNPGKFFVWRVSMRPALKRTSATSTA
jgi:quinol monooxygenase YgiN